VEKILRLELLNGGIQGVIIDENGAEHAALGIEVLRKRSFESRFSHQVRFALYSPSIRSNASAFHHHKRARNIAVSPGLTGGMILRTRMRPVNNR